MVEHRQAFRQDELLANKLKVDTIIILQVSLLREELCGSFRSHDKLIHHGLHIDIRDAVCCVSVP